MRKIKKRVETPQLIDDEHSYSVKSAVIIISIIVLIFGGFYYITTIVVNNQSSSVEDDSNVSEEYQSEKILFGQMLTRKESEYYVFAYDETSKYYELYNQYLTDYNKKEDALEVYKVDLNDGMNQNYVGSKMQIGSDLENLKVNDIVLFKIKDGKIVESFTTSTAISEEFKKLVNS